MQYMSQDNDPNNFSEFKKSEKKYRHYLKKQTDFSEIIDLNKYDSSMESICTKSEVTDKSTNKQYTVFKFKFPEGLYVIKNFLTIPEQLHLSKKCINEYHKKPNRTNLYIYDEEYHKNKDEPLPTYDKPSFIVDDPDQYYFNKKIRWSNIGFQYDWNDRLYPTGHTKIPEDLEQFPLRVLKIMNFGEYRPECVIVNYYAQRNYMGGHLDDGEKDQVSPIISFSIGLSCVFLIGGKTRDIKPHPIKLDSGDVLIMSGESRLCYHGVPRVIEDSFKEAAYMSYIKENLPEVVASHNQDLKREEDGSFINDEIHVVNYLKESRINFNFRQVYPEVEESLEKVKKE